MNAQRLGAQSRHQHQQQHQGHHVLADRAGLAINLLVAPQERPDYVDHDHGKDRLPASVSQIEVVEWAERIRTTIYARMHQPVASSTAAHAIATVPKRLLSMLRSERIRASTGKAVMLMAAPINSAKLVKATLSSESRV